MTTTVLGFKGKSSCWEYGAAVLYLTLKMLSPIFLEGAQPERVSFIFTLLQDSFKRSSVWNSAYLQQIRLNNPYASCVLEIITHTVISICCIAGTLQENSYNLLPNTFMDRFFQSASSILLYCMLMWGRKVVLHMLVLINAIILLHVGGEEYPLFIL